MVKKKLLTLDDLVRFCEQHQFTKFSAKDSGYQLAVQVPTTFEVEDDSDDSHRGMIRLKFRILHEGLNRNGSFVSKKSADKASKTIADRPILAAIHQLDDGSWDFETHNMEIIENEDGEQEVNYIEKQVGSFSSEKPFWEHDDEFNKDYLCAYGYIAEEYTKAADIIRNKNGWTKNSCELSIEKLSYNSKEKRLELDEFYLSASTLLGSSADGTPIGEGMLGSRADIVDFSEKNNSIFSQNDKVIEMLSALNEKIDSLNIDKNFRKEEENLVKKEFKETPEAEVKDTPAEVFEDDPKKKKKSDDDDVTPVDPDDGEDESGDDDPKDDNQNVDDDSTGGDNSAEETPEGENESQGSEDDESDTSNEGDNGEDVNYYSATVTRGDLTKTFAISLEDKQMAVLELVNATYGEVDNDWYNVIVYEEPRKEVVFYSWWSGNAYRQSYKVKKNEYTLDGERVPVHALYVTDDEENVIESMRSNYSAIETELAQYKAEPEKEAILAEECYSQIKDTDAYKALAEKDAHFSMSVDEVRAELDRQLLEYAKGHEIKFSSKEPEKKQVGMKLFGNPNKKSTKGSSRYGGLFSK